MADLDTRSKRASSVNFFTPYALDLVLPDGTIDQGDRQHIVWDYSGVLAQVITPSIIIGLICITFSEKQPALTFTSMQPAITFISNEDCD